MYWTWHSHNATDLPALQCDNSSVWYESSSVWYEISSVRYDSWSVWYNSWSVWYDSWSVWYESWSVWYDSWSVWYDSWSVITVRPEEKWANIKEAVTESAKTILGPKKRSIKTGLTKTIKPFKNYLAEKRAAFIDWQNHPNCVARRDKFKECQARAQRELRAMQDAWWEEKAEEIQRYADTKRTKQLCDAIKTIYGPLRRGSTPLLSADGSTINKEKEGFHARWQEHFSQLLHRPSVVD